MVLCGWKEIAQYMHCGVRTAQRRQQERLPVKRITDGPRAHVVAFSDEIDLWLRNGGSRAAMRFDFLDGLRRTRALRSELRRETEILRLRMRILRQGLATLRIRKEASTQLLADSVALPKQQSPFQSRDLLSSSRVHPQSPGAAAKSSLGKPATA
jgi:hypothetical protein